jgi:superfamily II DNA/RNA helicase
VLIATPGRLLDHFERGKLLMTGIEILVIDEADRMLDMGFIPDIERICKLTPFTRQTLFFTATMPPEIQRITEQFLSSPVQVEVSRPATAAATITQRLVASGSKDFEKRDTLRRILRDAKDLKNAIIFCNRKRDISVVVKSLEKHGFNVGGLHGDMDQRARMAMLDSFKTGKVPILVASDVAARGLDIPDVSHVLNYDVPIHADDYVHRIGRTGRAGRTGVAFMIVSRADTKYLDAINTLLKMQIEWDGPSLADFVPPSSDEEYSGEGRTGGRDGGRGRRGGRDRPGRGRFAEGADSSPRPSRRGARDRGTSDEVKDDAAAAPAAPAHPARPERPAPAARSHDDSRRPRDNRPPPPQSVAPARRNERGRDDDGPHVKGLGDHMPSFLMRPPRARG